MSRAKYERYEKRYNERTAVAAVNTNTRWTVAEEARLLRTWCRAAASPAARIHVAKVLGRTYVACAKRHAYLHVRRGNWRGCKADPRRRGS
jgi:hypothetical protein